MDLVVFSVFCFINTVHSENIPVSTESYNSTEEIRPTNCTVDSRLNKQRVSDSDTKVHLILCNTKMESYFKLVDRALDEAQAVARLSDICQIWKWQYQPRVPIIFGGSNANPGGFPHMGAVGWRAKNDSQWVFKCGGSLINADYVLTAAHCSWLSLRSHYDVVQNEPEVVRFGVENIVDSESNKYGGPSDKIIKRIIKHPNYKPPKRYHDIALIELRDKFSSFSEHLHPACLWTKPITFDNSEFKLSGWGLTEHGSPAHHLQFAKVDIIDSKTCDSLLAGHRGRNWQGIADHQLCAGNLSGKIDSCQGDSGGPLQEQIPLSSLYYIVGVTSFGIGCGKENRPGIYTKVYSFLDWIEQHVWKDYKESDFISSLMVFEATDERDYNYDQQ